MNLADLFARMKKYNLNAEVIFDPEEPLGQTTDIVMPRRRWFRRKKDCSIGPMRPIRPILP